MNAPTIKQEKKKKCCVIIEMDIEKQDQENEIGMKLYMN